MIRSRIGVMHKRLTPSSRCPPARQEPPGDDGTVAAASHSHSAEFWRPEIGQALRMSLLGPIMTHLPASPGAAGNPVEASPKDIKSYSPAWEFQRAPVARCTSTSEIFGGHGARARRGNSASRHRPRSHQMAQREDPRSPTHLHPADTRHAGNSLTFN